MVHEADAITSKIELSSILARTHSRLVQPIGNSIVGIFGGLVFTAFGCLFVVLGITGNNTPFWLYVISTLFVLIGLTIFVSSIVYLFKDGGDWIFTKDKVYNISSKGKTTEYDFGKFLRDITIKGDERVGTVILKQKSGSGELLSIENLYLVDIENPYILVKKVFGVDPLGKGETREFATKATRIYNIYVSLFMVVISGLMSSFSGLIGFAIFSVGHLHVAPSVEIGVKTFIIVYFAISISVFIFGVKLLLETGWDCFGTPNWYHIHRAKFVRIIHWSEFRNNVKVVGDVISMRASLMAYNKSQPGPERLYLYGVQEAQGVCAKIRKLIATNSRSRRVTLVLD